MHTFFHGWRRKAGTTTLVMACVLVGMWIRSRIVADAVIFRFQGEQLYYAASAHGQLFLQSWDRGYMRATYVIGKPLEGRQELAALKSFASMAVPYWSLAVPLTLLSAYLILWKPRTRESPPT